MSHYDEVNPFRDRTWSELSVACTHLAAELERPAKSAAEKRELAKNLRYLLIVMSQILSTGDTVPGSPEMMLRGGDTRRIAWVFSRWNESQVKSAARSARMATLRRAADYVLGRKAERWLNPNGVANPDRPIHRLDTDAMLDESLEALEALHHEPSEE